VNHDQKRTDEEPIGEHEMKRRVWKVEQPVGLFAGLLIIAGTIGLVQAGSVEDLLAGDFDWTTDTVTLKPDPRKMPPAAPEWSQVKDPSVVYYQHRWHLFCSILREVPEEVSGRLRIGYMSFSNWKDAQSTQWQFINLYHPGDFMGYHGAPQVFYFAPQKKWYLVYQLANKSRGLPYGPYYSTTANIGDLTSWTMPKLLHAIIPGNEGLDHWVICDDSYAYHFWTSLNGNLWMVRTQLPSFPNSGWTSPVIVKQNANLFEASHTYRIKGLNKYLTIAVNGESPRFYQAYIADQLTGPWMDLAATSNKPFAGLSNVTWARGQWAMEIDHGELIRTGYDQKLEVDPSDLRFVFQSRTLHGAWDYRLGILTSTHAASRAGP
jgi:hypothetical protein